MSLLIPYNKSVRLYACDVDKENGYKKKCKRPNNYAYDTSHSHLSASSASEMKSKTYVDFENLVSK